MVSLGLALGVPSSAQAAEAQRELWAFQDWYPRTHATGWGQPQAIRVGLVERANAALGARLSQGVLRVGPQWAFGRGWEFGLQLLTAMDQGAPGLWQEEDRLELELRGSQELGPWRWWGRGRLEARALAGGPRHRWRLLANLSREWPKAWPGLGGASPFGSAELFWEPQAGGWNQGRFQLGLSWPAGAGGRWSLAAMLRPRLISGAWVWDQVLSTSWTWREPAAPRPGPQ